MALDLTTVNQALKEHYKPLRVQNMAYRDNPLLAMMPKYTKFGGENMPIPIIFSNPQRRSATFGSAQDVGTSAIAGSTGTSQLKQFVLTRVKDYSFASITGESIKATERDSDAFLRYATMEVDGALHSLTRSLAVGMYRDGTGSRGLANAAPANSANMVVKLKNAEDVTNFEVGQVLNIFSAAGSQRIGKTGETGDFSVDAIDRDTGELTFTGQEYASGSGGTIAANDLIIAKGDRNLVVSGLEAWCPTAAPGSDLFFNVNRTADVTRLGGNRFDGSALPIEEALIGGAARVAREGGRPDHCFVDFATFSNLEKALGSKVVYSEAKARDVDIGFAGIDIRGPRGTIKVIPDQNCQPDVAWMLQMDTWSLNTLGEAPMFLDLDGNKMLRESSDDAYEIRLGYYGNVACNAPGYNCRVAL